MAVLKKRQVFTGSYAIEIVYFNLFAVKIWVMHTLSPGRY